MDAIEGEWLTPSQAARRLGVSAEWIRKLTEADAQAAACRGQLR